MASSKNCKEFCEAIIALHRAGHTNVEIVKLLKKLNVTYKQVYIAVKHYEETGSADDCPRSGWPRSQETAERIKCIRAKIYQNPIHSI